jgi:hypothetical protein
MDNDQKAKIHAHAQEYEAVLPLRVVVIEKLNCVFVEKHGFCFLERNPVFGSVVPILSLVPMESYHTYKIFTLCSARKREGTCTSDHRATPASVDMGKQRVSV